MLYFFAVFSLFFLFFYLFLFLMYQKLRRKNFSNFRKKDYFEKKNTFTLIVAFRNERERISPLLSAVQCQDYPKENFEIIFIDDHSDDGTSERIENELKNSALRYRIIEAAPDAQGKKAAVSRAVAESQTELIMCTDADCVPCPTWMSEMIEYFEEKKPEMLFSRVFIVPENNLVSNLQHIEFAALVAAGAIFAAIGKPLYGNAASMLFKKSTFLKVGGYEGNAHIPSGDDEFLLKKIAQIGRVEFCFSESANVGTFGAKTLASFMAQRVRWASKWRAHGDFFHAAGALGVFLMQLFRIVFLGSCFFSENI